LTVLLAYAFSIGTRELDNSGSWRIVIALGLVFCLILGVGIFFVPESPRWLIEKGRTEEARKGMARVRGLDENHPLVNSDFDEQWAAHELDKRAGTGSWAQCFLGEGKEVHNKAPYRTMVMIVMMAFQQLTGANVSLRVWSEVRSWADSVRVNVCVVLLLLRSYHLPVGRDRGLVCYPDHPRSDQRESFDVLVWRRDVHADDLSGTLFCAPSSLSAL
jgi:MFS family permease